MNCLVLGGTGTLGQALTKRLLRDGKTVTVFSRCELKQKRMARDFASHPRLRFVLGDIRDPLALRRAFRGVELAFLVAALKHVDVLEHNPEEAVRTDILGVMNVADAAIEARTQHVLFSSTDKAVEPVNVYGMCKAISERILLQRNHDQNVTHFSVYRWGNVIGSRGSVIPDFVKSLTVYKKAYLTHPEMTRFWIRIEDAVEFMLEPFRTSQPRIPTLKTATVRDVIDVTAELCGVRDYEIEITGMRPGEKIHESIVPGINSQTHERYTRDELRALLGPVVEASR